MKHKKELIKKVYGEKVFEKYQHLINEDGWCDILEDTTDIDIDGNSLIYEDLGYKYQDVDTADDYQCGTIWRPKTLRGIEHNNGWIRIYSESDLPNKNCLVKIKFRDGNQYGRINFKVSACELFSLRFSHYKIIELENEPIW